MKTRPLPFLKLRLLALGAAALCCAAAEEFRIWTDAGGRTVEAAYAGREGDQVRLRLRNGSVIPYPLDRLSADDRVWVEKQPAAPQPAPSGDAAAWPRSVALEQPPKATVVKEDPAAREFVYRTEHFEFRCDSKLGSDVVREFGRMFEGTRMVNVLLPLGLDPKPEPGQEFFVARLYSNKDDYFADGGVKGSAGIYSRGSKSIKVPLASLGVKLVGKRYMVEYGSDSDTLIHEITHQMMNHWLARIPQWYLEGSAMYVGSCVFNPSGRFTLPRLGQTVKNLQHLRQGKHTIWRLNYLMHITPQQWQAAFGDNPDGTGERNYASAIALTYYFYHGDDKGDGARIIAFLRDIAAGKRWEQAQDEHLIRGRDYGEIEKDLVATLRKGGISVEFADGPAASTGSSR